MMIRLLCFFLILFSQVIGYQRPEGISPELWDELSPYFLPQDHPSKSTLDTIFTSSKPLSDPASLKKIGLILSKPRKSGMYVASHKKLKEHKLKIFLHSHPAPEWWSFRRRIEGANLIRDAIIAHEYGERFKVPQKWLYPLPPTEIQTEGVQKHFVLVVEDMHISAKLSNGNYYRNSIRRGTLFALYTLVQENLLIDSIHIDNIPRCMDGKIAFVDTEHYMVEDTPIKWFRLQENLSTSNKKYLQKILDGK
ncbi:MAG: hypothetical protein WC222_04760 [Parachlamydiales bacterium]|jgi:hypothetical protein